MSTSMRQYLLRELGLEESKNLMNVSKFVRSSTRLEHDEKCECCVCKAPNKQYYPHEKGAEIIYNHHVMKVEYLAILTDRYNLCYPKKKAKSPSDLKAADYKFAPGFMIYSPRVGVCDIHHTMFHELVGDNELDIIRQIKINESENLIDVFNGFCDDVKLHCHEGDKDSENLQGYKRTYQSIWDETVLKSLTRLSYILRINELKSQVGFLSEEEKESTYYKYESILSEIDRVLKDTIDYDKANNLKLPDVEVFTQDELEMLEQELINISFDKGIEGNMDDYLDDDDNSYKITEEMYEESFDEINSHVSKKTSLTLSDIYNEDIFVDYTDDELEELMSMMDIETYLDMIYDESRDCDDELDNNDIQNDDDLDDDIEA